MSGVRSSCRVMGIVNVTPDSFSDGGRFFAPEEAIRRAMNLVEGGADILDIGGESTRPGSTPIDWEEEWGRIEPVLRGLSPSGLGTVPVSVDTYHPETAERAIDAGASIINCVYEEPVPRMLELMGKHKDVELVIPASVFGVFRSGGQSPSPQGGQSPGLPSPELRPRLYLDPMIGFGTTREEDVARLRSVSELARIGRVLVGASRKRIVKKLTGERMTGKNLGGNVGLAVWAAMNGASVVRVHDVRETVQALRVIAALAVAPSQLTEAR